MDREFLLILILTAWLHKLVAVVESVSVDTRTGLVQVFFVLCGCERSVAVDSTRSRVGRLAGFFYRVVLQRGTLAALLLLLLHGW